MKKELPSLRFVSAAHAVLAVALLVLTTSPVQADQITLTPVSMRTVCDGCRGPFDGVFEVFTGLPSIAPALLPTFEERGALEFSLLGINTADITSVSLLLSVQNILAGTAPVIEIHGFAGDGTVLPIDVQLSSLLHTSGPLTTVGPLAPIDVTAFVQFTLARGDPFVGFMFRTNVVNSAMFFNFTDDVPKLQVTTTAVPEPGSFVLLASGGLGFLLLRTRYS